MTPTTEQHEAIERLREWVKPGDTLYTILRHVSRSGMLRVVDIVKPTPDGQSMLALGWNVAKALESRFDREHEGIRVSGCGMDMGFNLVYELGRAMYPDGFGCPGKSCHSNDHSNGDRDYTPHAVQYTADTCPGRPCGTECDHKSNEGRDHWHRDGGYAFQQRWL